MRQSFIADFICSVYYDNFAKTVAAINPSIGIFSKKEFIKEVANKITYGFFVTVVKLEHMRHENERQSERSDFSGWKSWQIYTPFGNKCQAFSTTQKQGDVQKMQIDMTIVPIL